MQHVAGTGCVILQEIAKSGAGRVAASAGLPQLAEALGDMLVFWSIAMILGYFFIGAAKVAEALNAAPDEKSRHGGSRNLFQVAHLLVLWPRHVPMPWAALSAHVLIVAAILWGLGYFVGDLFVRAGIVVALLVVALSWYLVRTGKQAQ